MRIHNLQCCSARGTSVCFGYLQVIAGLIFGGYFLYVILTGLKVNSENQRRCELVTMPSCMIVLCLLNVISGRILILGIKKKSVSKLRTWAITEAFVIIFALACLVLSLACRLHGIYTVLELFGILFTPVFILTGLKHRSRLIEYGGAEASEDEGSEDGDNYVYGD